jgi:hypothetical protein
VFGKIEIDLKWRKTLEFEEVERRSSSKIFYIRK